MASVPKFSPPGLFPGMPSAVADATTPIPIAFGARGFYGLMPAFADPRLLYLGSATTGPSASHVSRQQLPGSVSGSERIQTSGQQVPVNLVCNPRVQREDPEQKILRSPDLCSPRQTDQSRIQDAAPRDREPRNAAQRPHSQIQVSESATKRMKFDFSRLAESATREEENSRGKSEKKDQSISPTASPAFSPDSEYGVRHDQTDMQTAGAGSSQRSPTYNLGLPGLAYGTQGSLIHGHPLCALR